MGEGEQTKPRITEEQARILLENDRLQLERRLKASNHKHKQILIAVIVMAVMLCVGGMVLVGMMK